MLIHLLMGIFLSDTHTFWLLVADNFKSCIFVNPNRIYLFRFFFIFLRIHSCSLAALSRSQHIRKDTKQNLNKNALFIAIAWFYWTQ